MHLFHLKAERGQNDSGAMTTGLVAADTLFDAFVLVPDGNTVKAARVELGVAQGPVRLIGCVNTPGDPRTDPSREDQALGPTGQCRLPAAHQLRWDGRISQRRG